MSKTKELKQENRKNINIKKSKLVNRNGFPQSKKVKCFKKGCKEVVKVKYVVPNKSYSKINNWEYWVNPESKNSEFWKDKKAREKDCYICNSHLLALYYNKEEYWKTIPDLRRRAKLTSYIFDKTITTNS